MTMLCWLVLVIGFCVGVGATTLLWAACGLSGAHADAERSADEQ